MRFLHQRANGTWNTLCSSFRSADTKREKTCYTKEFLLFCAPRLPLETTTVLQSTHSPACDQCICEQFSREQRHCDLEDRKNLETFSRWEKNFFRQWPFPKVKVSKFLFEDSSNTDRLISPFTHFILLQVAILSWMTCLNLEHNVLILSNKEITIMYNYFACPFLNCNTINMKKICLL